MPRRKKGVLSRIQTLHTKRQESNSTDAINDCVHFDSAEEPQVKGKLCSSNENIDFSAARPQNNDDVEHISLSIEHLQTDDVQSHIVQSIPHEDKRRKRSCRQFEIIYKPQSTSYDNQITERKKRKIETADKRQSTLTIVRILDNKSTENWKLMISVSQD